MYVHEHVSIQRNEWKAKKPQACTLSPAVLDLKYKQMHTAVRGNEKQTKRTQDYRQLYAIGVFITREEVARLRVEVRYSLKNIFFAHCYFNIKCYKLIDICLPIFKN